MLNNNGRTIYWDSNVFLSHINGMPDRIKTINHVISEIAEIDSSIILTSSESIAEVAHAVYEKVQKHLDPKVEAKIDAMWEDSSVVRLIDNGQHIAKIARSIIRGVIPNGWVLKSKDAIHLASAMWYNQNVGNIDEFQTYDEKLYKYQPIVGIPIAQPHVLQYRMNFTEAK